MYTAYPAVSVGAWVGPGSRRGGGCPLSLRLRARRQTCCPRRVWHPRMVTDGQSHPWSAAAEGAFLSPTPLTTAVSAWSSASMPPSLRTELPACPRFTGHYDSHRHRGEGGAGRGQKRRTVVVSLTILSPHLPIVPPQAPSDRHRPFRRPLTAAVVKTQVSTHSNSRPVLFPPLAAPVAPGFGLCCFRETTRKPPVPQKLRHTQHMRDMTKIQMHLCYAHVHIPAGVCTRVQACRSAAVPPPCPPAAP